MLLRHLYIVAAVCVTSALINGQKRDKELNVLSNQLTGVINNSMSIKIGERNHNVASISKRSTLCDVTYINFVVCRLGLASQGVTF
jgi:hypothetical protein